jgi:hypothetical protein
MSDIPKIYKKRGRKPKGGKFIESIPDSDNPAQCPVNIIVHLKCNLRDISPDFTGVCKYIPEVCMNIEPFNIIDTSETNYGIVEFTEPHADKYNVPITCKNQILQEKLKSLQVMLHLNQNINEINSACFWCTCPFNNPSIHIPKYKSDDKFYVYGHFCSPECAMGFLVNEKIAESTMFERLQLLNYLYEDFYDNISIKPAPSPFYCLSKYMGNLSIDEYRSYKNFDKIINVIHKPMSTLLPEVYEDNLDVNKCIIR